ncbi:MAG: YqeG family HAD IIIA-type phosphatase [Candidatus Izemoplasmatales bacterium]
MIDFLLKETYYIPDDFQKTVYDIDYQKIWDKGIRVILIDLDNTLIPYDESMPNDEIKKLFHLFKQIGFEVVIVSNNHLERVEPFAKEVGSMFICSARKPLKKGFLRAMSLVGNYKAHEVCVIGDQFMTDCLGGKRLGFDVIVVNAIKRKVEKWYTKLNRKLEKRMIHRIKKHQPEIYNKLHLSEKR